MADSVFVVSNALCSPKK